MKFTSKTYWRWRKNIKRRPTYFTTYWINYSERKNKSDLCGLDAQIMEVELAVRMPLDHIYLFENKTPFSTFLFYGPPGTGKTLIAKAVAA